MTDVKNKPEKKDDLQGRMAWQEAERLIGYQFTDKTLLQSALTHSSVAATPAQSYERLEFFGDRILGLVLSDWLYRTFEAEDQGELTTRFHALAKGEYLASVCIKLGLQNCLFQENGQKKLAERASVQADIIEAVIAAIYLDGGLVAAEKFIKTNWQVDKGVPDSLAENPKSALQEWAAAEKLGIPEYHLHAQSGSDHEPEFHVRVELKGFPAATASGPSRKAAERAAATAFIQAHIQPKKGKK